VPKPVLQALLLADHVYQDKDTGKKVIAGTFNQLNLSKLKAPPKDAEQAPMVPRRLSPGEVSRMGNPTAFISLTDVRGPTDLQLRYVDLADNGVLLMIQFQVSSDDPLKTVEAILPVPPLPTPHPGVYALELHYDDEALGALRVTVVEMPHS